MPRNSENGERDETYTMQRLVSIKRFKLVCTIFFALVGFGASQFQLNLPVRPVLTELGLLQGQCPSPVTSGSASGFAPVQSGSASEFPPVQSGSASGFIPVQSGSTSGFPPVQSGSASGFPPVQSGSASGFPPVQSGSASGFPPVQSGSASVFPPVQSGSASGFPPVQSGSASGFPPVTSGSASGFPPVQSGSASGFPPVQSGSASGFPASGFPPVTSGSASGFPPVQSGSASGASGSAGGSINRCSDQFQIIGPLCTTVLQVPLCQFNFSSQTCDLCEDLLSSCGSPRGSIATFCASEIAQNCSQVAGNCFDVRSAVPSLCDYCAFVGSMCFTGVEYELCSVVGLVDGCTNVLSSNYPCECFLPSFQCSLCRTLISVCASPPTIPVSLLS